jgi:hypothetical protein
MKYFYAILLLSLPFFVDAQTWQRKNSIKGAVCSDLISLTSGKIITLSTDGVYASTDNADNWLKISADMDADLSNYVNDVEPNALHLSNDTVYAYFRSKLYRSTNEGVNWSLINTSTVRPAYETTFGIKNSNLFLTKTDFNTRLSTLYISKDAGANWSIADTVTAAINIFTLNNELYLWGYTGSLWSSKSAFLKKLDAENKMVTVNTAGIPANTDIRGMGAAGNNLVLMIPEYNQNSTIIATRLFGYNGSTWVKGTEFSENYSKLYTAGGFCFHPFFNSPKVLRSKNGIDWTNVSTSSLYGYYSSIKVKNGSTFLASSRAGIFELDTNFNRVEKNNGLFAASLGDMLVFKNKIYVSSPEAGVSVSADNAISFSAVNISTERTGTALKASANNLYVFNAYLMPSDKIYKSVDGVAWDTLVMPAGNFSQRQVLGITTNGVWMSVTESNVKSYKFYNEQSNTWADVSTAVPSNASYFNTYNGVSGNLVVVNNYYENNIKKTAIYELENNASNWKLLKHTMGDVWYENTSVYNNEFYFLKNTYFKPDSLFKIKNDSLVFEKVLKYGSYKFYTDNFYESFFYRGTDIYCLGFDSTQQNTITIIRSIDAGLTWQAFNAGLSAGTQVKSLLIGSSILATSSKGLYEYGGTSSYASHANVELSTMYPNPANKHINIKSISTGPIELTVFNLNGTKIRSEKTKEDFIQIDVSTLENGIYILQILTDKGIETKKLMVQH